MNDEHTPGRERPVFHRGRGMTVTEVAELTGHSGKTVRGWITRGELEAFIMGRRSIRVFEADLDRFLAARRVHGGAA